MNSDRFERSQKLRILAERLRNYKPDPTFDTANDKTPTNSRIQGPIQTSESVDNPNAIPSERIKTNRAAVLICLFEGDEGDLRVILTKRSSTLSSHSGEVALPGGKMEEADTNDAATALRESKEEIGLDPCAVDVVTVLHPFHSKRNITVIPVIGIMWDKDAFNAVPNVDEDENRRAEEREWMGSKYLLHFFDHQVDNETYVIWALTAAILIKAASVVYNRPPAFEELRPKFWSRSRQ